MEKEERAVGGGSGGTAMAREGVGSVGARTERVKACKESEMERVRGPQL